MLWYIKHIYERVVIGVCFLGVYMVAFNTLVEKENSCFLSLKKTWGRNYKTVSNRTTVDHQTCSCLRYSVPKWQIILLTLPWLPLKTQSHQLHWCPAPIALLWNVRAGQTPPCRGGTPCPNVCGMAGSRYHESRSLQKTDKTTQEYRLFYFSVQHPPFGAIHQPERNAQKDYLILYSDLRKNAWLKYFGNAW